MLTLTGYKSLRELKAEGRLLRDLSNVRVIVRSRISARGGAAFEAGEEAQVYHTYRGRMNIEEVGDMPAHFKRRITGVSLAELYLQEGQELPEITKKVRAAQTAEITCGACLVTIRRAMSFRSCCSVRCWIRWHPQVAETIIRDHFSRTSSKDPS